MNLDAAVTLSGVTFETRGRTTIATLTYPQEGTMARLGAVASAPELVRDLVGVGIARCRPEDHFDPTIGRYLAVQRAQIDLAVQIERRVLERVQTEQDYQIDQAGLAAAAAMDELQRAFNHLLRVGGVPGQIVTQAEVR